MLVFAINWGIKTQWHKYVGANNEVDIKSTYVI